MTFCPKWCYRMHYGEPHVACASKTTKGSPCPITADRMTSDGEAVCHVHDPNGKKQADLAEAKAAKSGMPMK